MSRCRLTLLLSNDPGGRLRDCRGAGRPEMATFSSDESHQFEKLRGWLMEPRWIVVLLSLAFAASSTSAQSVGPASIAGRVREVTGGGALPGVAVTIESGGVRRTIVTRGEGEFEFLDLRPGVYSFSAALTAFVLRKTDAVVVTPGSAACVILTLDLAPGAIAEIGPTIVIPRDSRHFDLRPVDSVVRLKVTATATDCVCGYASVSADVAEVVKANQPLGDRVTFLEDRLSDRSRLCKVGEEYVLFLTRDRRGLVRSSAMTGGFLIRAGTVEPLFGDGWERYVGMPVGDLLAELRGLPAEK